MGTGSGVKVRGVVLRETDPCLPRCCRRSGSNLGREWRDMDVGGLLFRLPGIELHL